MTVRSRFFHVAIVAALALSTGIVVPAHIALDHASATYAHNLAALHVHAHGEAHIEPITHCHDDGDHHATPHEDDAHHDHPDHSIGDHQTIRSRVHTELTPIPTAVISAVDVVEEPTAPIAIMADDAEVAPQAIRLLPARRGPPHA